MPGPVVVGGAFTSSLITVCVREVRTIATQLTTISIHPKWLQGPKREGVPNAGSYHALPDGTKLAETRGDLYEREDKDKFHPGRKIAIVLFGGQ